LIEQGGKKENLKEAEVREGETVGEAVEGEGEALEAGGAD